MEVVNSIETPNDGGILSDITSRHGHSAQPESKQMMAVLTALTEVIKAEGLPISPTSLFAACMSAMERIETLGSPQVTLAMCSLLGMAIQRLPNSVLRAKFVGSCQVLGAVLDKFKDQAAVARAALHCLSQVLSALDPTNWPAAVAPFALLISFVTDGRPKVRKRAQAGLGEALAGLQRGPALGPASETLLKYCQAVLPGPEAAARAAASASNKNRAAAEAAIAKAVSDALHLIGALKEALPLMAGPQAKAAADLLLKLYSLRQPLLSRHATDALGALCGSRASHLDAPALGELIGLLSDGEGTLWERSDADTAASFARLLDSGLSRLHEVDAALCAQRLPRAFHALVAQLSAEQDGARLGASLALRGIIRSCIDAPMMAAAAAAAGGGGSAPRTLQGLVAAVAGTLTSRYMESWGLALPVAAELLERLGACGDGTIVALADPIVEQLGQMLAGAAEADDEDVEAAGGAADAALANVASGRPGGSAHAAAAEGVLGTALRALGPQAVLRVLPLNLKEGIDGTAEPRTWMLLLMKKHVRGTSLAFWSRHLMPLAKALGARAVSSTGQLSQSCAMLEQQIWACLPAFASWAPDIATAYPAVVKDLAAAFSNRPDLRTPICSTLQRMASQCVRVLHTAGRTDLLGARATSAAATAAMGGTGLSAHRPPRPAPLGGGDSDEEFEDDASDGRADNGSDSDDDRGGGGGPGAKGGGGAGVEDLEAAGIPACYDEAAATASLGALRQFARNWLPLLFKTFLEAAPEQRANVAGAISAYALVTDAAVLSGFFKTVLFKLIKVVEDAGLETQPRDMVLEGGSDAVARRCSFLELALCLAPGLDDAALLALQKAAKPCLLDSEASVQKKGYKVLSYLCASRPAFLRANVQEVVDQVVGGTVASLSASKRHRLRCFKPLIMLLDSPDCPPVTMPVDAMDEQEEYGGKAKAAKAASAAPAEAAAAAAGDAADIRAQLVAGLVGELVLCTKEANTKTRSAAYALLIQIGHSMDKAQPAPVVLQTASDMQVSGAAASAAEFNKGGLHRFFTMVMAGLVGSTPHMVSAAVMALARLLYEFAPQLEALVPELLPTVLLLLRTKSRETVKSVLGFVKVCAMRMPVEVLLPQLGPILEGLLLWSDDSKNKFKLKVRVIVERLARRCGHDALAEVIPPGEVRLLTHIRKQNSRKERRRAWGGTQADEGDGDEDARSFRSGAGRSSASGPGGARTARASEWGHSKVFSDEEEEQRAKSEYGGGRAGARSAREGGPSSARGGGRAGSSGRLREGGEPLDLLDKGAARQLVKTAAGVRRGRSTFEASDLQDDFKRGENGRIMVEEEDPFAWQSRKKRKQDREEGGYDSGDSDFEDMKSYGGMSQAFKSHAKSVKFNGSAIGAASTGGRSRGGSQAGGRSRGGAASTVGGRSARSNASGKSQHHSGDRYKPKGKVTGGDVKPVGSKVEPYAYWKFDRKMLNRRKGKQAVAHKSLSGIVEGAQAGALRGAKAKRMAAGGGRGRRPTPGGGRPAAAEGAGGGVGGGGGAAPMDM